MHDRETAPARGLTTAAKELFSSNLRRPATGSISRDTVRTLNCRLRHEETAKTLRLQPGSVIQSQVPARECEVLGYVIPNESDGSISTASEMVRPHA